MPHGIRDPHCARCGKPIDSDAVFMETPYHGECMVEYLRDLYRKQTTDEARDVIREWAEVVIAANKAANQEE